MLGDPLDGRMQRFLLWDHQFLKENIKFVAIRNGERPLTAPWDELLRRVSCSIYRLPRKPVFNFTSQSVAFAGVGQVVSPWAQSPLSSLPTVLSVTSLPLVNEFTRSFSSFEHLLWARP